MANEDNPIDSVTGGVDVAPTEGGEAVNDVTQDTSSQAPSDAISLKEINEVLGIEYPDKDTALKAWKDTKSYVGKRQEKAVEEAKETLDSKVLEELATSRQKLEELTRDNFYAKNPEYNDVQELIESSGKPREEFIKSEAFKSVFDKVKGYEKAQEAENVLKTNPKLADTQDSLDKSRTALSEGNFRAAEDSAVDAVLKSL